VIAHLREEYRPVKKLYILILLMIIAIVGSACDNNSSNGTNSGPAAVSTINLGKGYDSTTGAVIDPTVVFTPSDQFHCVVELTSAPDGTTIRTLWTTVDATDASGTAIKDTKLDEVTVSTQNGNRFVDTFPAAHNPWPVGKYKVEIFLNDKSVRTLNFSVIE
jgi:hypothetical protein